MNKDAPDQTKYHPVPPPQCQGKEGKNHYKLYKKGGKMQSFFNKYLSSTYISGTEVRALNQTNKNPCPHGAYIPVGLENKMHCMLYGGKCSEE